MDTPTELRTIGFRAPAEVAQKFRVLCVKNGVSVAEVCNAFVAMLISAHEESNVRYDVSDKVKKVIGPVCKIQE